MEKTYYLPTPQTGYNFCNLLLDAPHVIIGGATGSGKSVLIDDIIWTVLGQHYPFANDPNGVQMVLIDPKKVTLRKYLGVPHVIDYLTENDEIIAFLDSIIETMMDRYDDMTKKGLELYDGCKILIIIDELADLMTTCKKEFVPRVQRIAQLGRAAKIQIVAATQCPSREIIPAKVTVNFTGRVALRCNNAIESRQLINKNGAELLPRHGKAMYLHADGAYYNAEIDLTSKKALSERIDFWKAQGPLYEAKPKKKATAKPKHDATPIIGKLINVAFWGVLLYCFYYLCTLV